LGFGTLALVYQEAIAKLHSEPNLRFFRWIRLFAKCLWPRGYVTLQKIEPTKKSSNFAREASYATPSQDIEFCFLEIPPEGPTFISYAAFTQSISSLRTPWCACGTRF